jgi:hypothetical protein
MQSDLERKIKLAVNTYLPQYEQIVRERFGHIQDISAIIPVFNEVFPNEPKGEKWITHPESLRDGNMTCDMAVMILAVWWSIQKALSSSVAKQDFKDIYERNNIKAHYLVGLHSQKVPMEKQIDQYYEQRNREQAELNSDINKLYIAWLHWTPQGGLQTIGRINGKLNSPINVTVQEMSAYSIAVNRIRSHSLPATKHIVAENNPALID